MRIILLLTLCAFASLRSSAQPMPAALAFPAAPAVAEITNEPPSYITITSSTSSNAALYHFASNSVPSNFVTFSRTNSTNCILLRPAATQTYFAVRAANSKGTSAWSMPYLFPKPSTNFTRIHARQATNDLGYVITHIPSAGSVWPGFTPITFTNLGPNRTNLWLVSSNWDE